MTTSEVKSACLNYAMSIINDAFWFFICPFKSCFYGPKLLDVLLVVIIFSFYSFRQSLKHQSVIKSQLKHKDIIASLCEDILCSFHSCLQLAEQMIQSDAQVKIWADSPVNSSFFSFDSYY